MSMIRAKVFSDSAADVELPLDLKDAWVLHSFTIRFELTSLASRDLEFDSSQGQEVFLFLRSESVKSSW